MNIAEAFKSYLVNTLGIATSEQVVIGIAPSSKRKASNLWWILTNGGAPIKRLHSGETLKNYQIQVFYRSNDYRSVYDKLHELEEDLNCDGCSQLSGFDTIDIEATVLSIDNDLDSEDRKVGLLQTNITTYKECD